MPAPQVSSLRWADAGLLFVFFASGAAALVYQVCWQRMLYGAFGIDLESITLIVSAFMLGLGCGALIGGFVADRFPSRIVVAFGVVELLIGGFGVASPMLISNVADSFVHAGRPLVFMINFLLLLAPTTAMGATLPMLVAHLHRRSGNVGFSIGQLYLSNTFGAALGCLTTSFVAFHYLTLDETIWSAALVNGFVGGSAFTWLRRGA